jgi:DNA-binding NarL/FixJ family response regulator
MNPPKFRIMLVDDHPMVRQGMSILINTQSDLEVVAQAGEVNEAIAMISQATCPDIVLIDISLKGLSGFELIRNLHVNFPSLPVLVVSMHDEMLHAERALKDGARGYVMKQEAGDVLLTAIRHILQGNIYLSSAMQAHLLERIGAGGTADSLVNRLTSSEFEILHLIGAGHTSQEIANLLNRSIKTIESHRHNIRNKLALKDGADLIRFATQLVIG